MGNCIISRKSGGISSPFQGSVQLNLYSGNLSKSLQVVYSTVPTHIWWYSSGRHWYTTGVGTPILVFRGRGGSSSSWYSPVIVGLTSASIALRSDSSYQGSEQTFTYNGTTYYWRRSDGAEENGTIYCEGWGLSSWLLYTDPSTAGDLIEYAFSLFKNGGGSITDYTSSAQYLVKDGVIKSSPTFNKSGTVTSTENYDNTGNLRIQSASGASFSWGYDLSAANKNILIEMEISTTGDYPGYGVGSNISYVAGGSYSTGFTGAATCRGKFFKIAMNTYSSAQKFWIQGGGNLTYLIKNVLVFN